MNCKLQTAILLILSLLFAQSGFAQDDNADISLEKLEIVTEDKTVNNMIDEVVNDYLIKEEIQNSVLITS